MNWFRGICYLPFLLLFLMVFASMASPVIAAEDRIELSCQYPMVRGPSGTLFEFQVDLKYEGEEARTFDLRAQGPQGWYTSIQPAYGEAAREISAIRLQPGQTYPDRIKLLLATPYWVLPEPGDYVVKLEAKSGDIVGSIELQATVTARYDLAFNPKAGRYNTKITSGEESHFPLVLENYSTAVIENATFSSDNPGGWTVTFNPDKVDSLAVGTKREIDAVINAPRKTIAGDYMITLRSSSERASDLMDIRVTVLAPTVWGWVGAGIVVAVIAGLAVVFMRLGRR